MEYKGVYYSTYLQLDKILNAQDLESDKLNAHAHDEMLFIIIHQAYELWFKQVLFEAGSILNIISKPQIVDNSPDVYLINHRLKRIIKILQVLIHQIDVMETMTALDFLDFRDMLRPASGFQSMQFKILEAKLGLRMENRHGKEYYISQLKPEDAAKIVALEKETTLLIEINEWLERMPYFDNASFWVENNQNGLHPFWENYVTLYGNTLTEREKGNVAVFKEKFLSSEKRADWNLSPKARRNALFIFLYRDMPLLQQPFELLQHLLEIDECMATWRYRHMNMVHRIIGTRTGTGGSTGKDYLKGALDSHYIFSEIAEITSFLVNRKSLPKLSPQLEKQLGFVSEL